MAQPVWVTPAGSLGSIPEGIFYQVSVIAYDPDYPEGHGVYYDLLAGQLPPGIQCSKAGLITGVPSAVQADTTSTFAVRAYTEKIVNGKLVVNRLADRTFSLTVTYQNSPRFLTPAGRVGQFYDGTPIEPIQILTTDPYQGSVSLITIATGSLPPGLSISTSGLITGYIIPLSVIENPGGFDRTGQNFDMNPFDFIKASPNTNFQFTLEVTEGAIIGDLRTYEIYVVSRTTLQASTTDITADDTFVDASQTPTYHPFLTNAQPSNLGTVRAGNFWAYQFLGLTFGEYTIEYLEYPGAGLQLPPGTFLDAFTGWLYGYLPNLGAVEITYDFAIYLIDTNDAQTKSRPYYFSLTLVGPIETQVIWLTDANLGSIINGSTSLLRVEAVNVSGKSLQYRLRPGASPPPDYIPGVYNKLPQGLELLSSGDIAGRVSFNTFALDLGTTTFDKLLQTSLVKSPQETTFDTEYTFTVNAYSLDGTISVFKTFTVKVLRVYNEPYENLYIKAMPPYNDRALVNSLIQNSDIFKPEYVFREQDPNFGVATSVVYNHAYGLTSSTYELYISSLNENHYWKNLVLGEIKTAQAIDPKTGNVIYEVVYSAIQDNLVNNAGMSVSKQVTLPYPVDYNGQYNITTVYPNSLDNMRNQVIDVVGQISNLLPLWMLSKQSNGKVLGFTPAWVIAYCNPGTSGQVAYNISKQFGQQLNLVDFEVDRYELDRLLSKYWDPIGPSMTYDPEYTGNHLAISNRGLAVSALEGIVGEPTSLTTQAINYGQKVMFSVTIDLWAPTAEYTSVGIANHQMDVQSWLGQTSNSVGFWDDGYLYANGQSGVSGFPAFGYDGAIVDVAVDRLNDQIWIRVDGGLWNNLPDADPTLLTGGVDISYLKGDVYPGVNVYYSLATEGRTSINTSAKYTVPIGFEFIGEEKGSWIPSPAEVTTFDANRTGTKTPSWINNNLDVVRWVNNNDEVVVWSNTYNGKATTFDGNSMRFEAPVDMYSDTTVFDKYLVFPKRNILG